MKPRNFDKPDRPFNKFRSDGPRPDTHMEGERPFRKPFGGHDPRAQFDDEQFVSSGELADIVGTHPLDRREILRRMWRHYQDAGLVKSIGGSSRPPRERSERPTRDRDDRPPRRFEDRPPRRFDDRPPRREGDREGAAPRRYERSADAAPRRYARKPEDGERSFSRDREDRPRPYARKSSSSPRTSTRKPAGSHPTARKSAMIDKAPRRKFKDTRESNEG